MLTGMHRTTNASQLYGAGRISDDWVDGNTIAGVINLTPSAALYEMLLNETATGFDAVQKTWRHTQAEQTLVTKVLKFGMLPAPMQMFADICYFSTDPLRYFPLRRMSFVHYTWQKQNPYAWTFKTGQDSICWNQFGELYQHFERHVLTATSKLAYRADSLKR